MSIVLTCLLRVSIFFVAYIVYLFAGMAILFLLEDYYHDEYNKQIGKVLEVLIVVLWPIASIIFFISEGVKSIRQQLNNKKK